jgi:hypothetical protein
MIRVRFNILLLIGLFGVLSCKKDKTPIPIDPECAPYDFSIDIGMPAYKVERITFSKPCFNPKNNQEFVYYYRNVELGLAQVYKYNMQTKQKTLLVDNFSVLGQMKWSSNGWIAMTHSFVYNNRKVFIVQDNGENLTQIPSSVPNANDSPFWNASEDRIYWIQNGIEPNPKLVSMSLDDVLNGISSNETIESDQPSSYAAVNANNLVISPLFVNNARHFCKANLDDSNLVWQPFYSLETFPNWGISSLCFGANNEDFYFSVENLGLYKLNISNQKLTLLITFCERKNYDEFSCSPDGKHLLCRKKTDYLETDETGSFTGFEIQKQVIVRINLKTMTEELIDLQ